MRKLPPPISAHNIETSSCSAEHHIIIPSLLHRALAPCSRAFCVCLLLAPVLCSCTKDDDDPIIDEAPQTVEGRTADPSLAQEPASEVPAKSLKIEVNPDWKATYHYEY